MLFGHGSDAYKYDHKIIADFSSNVWYKGLPDGLSEYLSAKIPHLIHYPEPDAGKLHKRIAEFHDISANNILATNGASEGLYLIAQLFKNSQSSIIYPSFSEYEDACVVNNHRLSFICNQNIDFQEKLKPSFLIWLGNPNNPDGEIVAKQELIQWIGLNPKTIFIIDEAYGDLCFGFESLCDSLYELPNLIIVKSFTKIHAIPGLRLGYILASEQIIQSLKQIKIPWSVNSMAIEAGIYVLNNQKDLVPDLEDIQKESLDFQNKLSNINGLKVSASNCNYFLAELENRKASSLKNYLVKEHGLLIRDASNFRGLTESHFRVALQNSEMNNKLAEAIKTWMQNA